MRIRKLLVAGTLAAAGVVLLQAAPAMAAPVSHEAEECVKKLEAGGKIDDCQVAPSPILPATNEIVWGGGAFIILFVVMAKFGYPAMRSMMDARTERLRADLDAAEEAKNEALALLAEYQRQLADARNEASRLIEEARQQAEQVRRDLTARAEAEAAELRQRTTEQVAAERDRVLGELRTQVAGLAIELAEKVVEANLDRDANLRLIENYINQVGDGART